MPGQWWVCLIFWYIIYVNDCVPDLEHYYCNRVWFPWYTLETETPKSRQESQTGSCDASTPETALLSNASPEMGHHPDRSSSFPKQISSVTSSPTPLNRILPHLGSPRSSQSLVVSRPSSAIDASSSSLSRSSEPKPYPGRKIRQNSVPLAHAPWLLESEKGLHSSPELIPLSLCQNCDGMTAMQSSRPLTSAKYRGGQVVSLSFSLRNFDNYSRKINWRSALRQIWMIRVPG